MSKRKADSRPQQVPTVEITTTQPEKELDPVVWSDPLRGILLALVKESRQLWDSRYHTSKEKCLQIFVDIANILINSDGRITGFFVLEKMCYMTEMLYRTIGNPKNVWRYANSMSFLLENEGNGAAFLNCITKQRFAELGERYGNPQEVAISERALPNLPSSIITGVFKDEMTNFHNYVKGCKVPPVHTLAQPAENKNDLQAEVLERPLRRATRSMGAQKQPTTIQEIMETLNQEPRLEIKEEVVEEEEPTNITVPLSPQSKAALDEKIPWTKSMNLFLIETIRVHPILWHRLAPGFDDTNLQKQELAKVLRQLKTMPGGEMLDEQAIEQQWEQIRQVYNAHYQKLEQLSLPSNQSGWDLYAHLQFLSPQVMAACRFGNVTVEDIPYRPNQMQSRLKVETMATDLLKQKLAADDAETNNQLRKILGYVPPHMESHNGVITNGSVCTDSADGAPSAKHIAFAAPVKQEVVATWVPPKEHSLAAALMNMNKAFTPVTTAGPTATAEITTSSCPKLMSLLRPVHDQSEKITKMPENGVTHDKKRHEKPIDDKWTSLGRMIEHTCRGVEARSLEASIKLQKDINDILYKYQMESLYKQ